MKRTTIYLLLIVSAATLISFVPWPAWADDGKRVLVVHSYHESQKGHVVEMTEGIREALAGMDIRLRFFHMDTKRKNSTAWKKKAGETAREIVADFAPHVVIAMDDNAQEYFAKHYAGEKSAPPIVFGGVNAEPEKYGYPAENVTGIIERPNILESMELLRRIVPGARRIALLSDKSPTTNPFCGYAGKLSLPLTTAACVQVETFDQWKATVEKYRNRVDAFGIYVSRTVRRTPEGASHVPEEELVAWLKEHTGLPTVGFFDSSARAGILCGISVSMKEQGFAAARVAREILGGGKPSDYPVRPTAKGRILLNLSAARALGIELPYKMIKRADEVVK